MVYNHRKHEDNCWNVDMVKKGALILAAPSPGGAAGAGHATPLFTHRSHKQIQAFNCTGAKPWKKGAVFGYQHQAQHAWKRPGPGCGPGESNQGGDK